MTCGILHITVPCTGAPVGIIHGILHIHGMIHGIVLHTGDGAIATTQVGMDTTVRIAMDIHGAGHIITVATTATQATDAADT